MQKNKTAGKAARPCKSPAALKLKLEIPAETKSLLAACTAYNECSLENYILAALASTLRCDVENFATESHAALATLERGHA